MAGNDESARGAAVDYGKTASFLSIGVGLTGADHLRLLLHRLARALEARLRARSRCSGRRSSSPSRPSTGRSTSCSRATSPSGWPRASRSASRCGSRRRSSSAWRSPSPSSPWPCAGPLQDGLLEGNETLYWVFFSAVLFYAASYFARGYLAGAPPLRPLHGADPLRVGASARSSPCWSRSACSAASRRSRSGSSPPRASACWSSRSRSAAGRGRNRRPPSPARPLPDAKRRTATGEEFSLSHGAGFAARGAADHVQRAGLPQRRAADHPRPEGAAAAGFIFNVLMIARAPLQLFQAVSTSILPHLTTLHTSEERGQPSTRSTARCGMVLLGDRRLHRRSSRWSSSIAGPQLMQLAFSDKFTYDRAGLLLVTARHGPLPLRGDGQPGLPRPGPGAPRLGPLDRLRGRSSSAWNLLPLSRRVPPGRDRLRRSPPASSSPCSTLIYRHPHERAEDVPSPGSTEELEARLAAADEGT